MESVIGTDAGVDQDELLSESSEESIPVGSLSLPVDGLVVGSPPQSSLILEEHGSERDAVIVRNRGEGAELLHLENPCFQRLRFLATEWWQVVRLDTRGSLGLDLGYLDSCNLVLVLLEFSILGGKLLSQRG